MPDRDARWPADDPAVLGKQLVRELNRLVRAAAEGAKLDNPWLYQVYLEKFQLEAWMQALNGDLGGVRSYSQHLTEAEDLIVSFVPEPDVEQPHIQAAREVNALARAFEVADRCFSIARSERQVRDRQRSSSEREVLAILFESAGLYLRRGEIHKRMRVKPTPGRVSQILSTLQDEGLLLRSKAKAQGNSETWFFALSELGRDLCQSLGIGSASSHHFEVASDRWRDLLRQPQAVGIGAAPVAGRIAAFYGNRRGLGRTFALANCAIQLGHELAGGKILLMDLTFERSELYDYVGADHADCLGLRGLLKGYKDHPEEGRQLWLQGALNSMDYVVRSQAAPSLYLLPLGVDLEESRFREMEDQLFAEVKKVPRADTGAPVRAAAGGFWGDLRDSMENVFQKVLIDTPIDPGPVLYASTILLGDELFVFMRPHEQDFVNLRKVIGNFLWRESRGGEVLNAPVTFVFSMLPQVPKPNLRRMVDCLLGRDGVFGPEDFYRILYLVCDPAAMQGDALVDRTGQWKWYVRESVLVTAYEGLKETLKKSLSAPIWKSRMRQLDRRFEASLPPSNSKKFATPPRYDGAPALIAPGIHEGENVGDIIKAAEGLSRGSR